jgi:Glycosyl hydrolase family 20, domain 2
VTGLTSGPAGRTSPVIPAPVRLTPGAGEFRLDPAAAVVYRDPVLGPLARRFAADVGRRCGIPLRTVPSGPEDATQAIVIGLGQDPDFARLPAPLGIDPAGTPGDERYLLAIDQHRITLRAREPAGLARGLASLVQLIATAPTRTTSPSFCCRGWPGWPRRPGAPPGP